MPHRRTTNTYFTERAHVLVVFGLSCTLLTCIFNLKKKVRKQEKVKEILELSCPLFSLHYSIFNNRTP